mgnify:CR=1 FL=1
MISIDINNLDENNIIKKNKELNKILKIPNCYFTQLLYSTETYSLNGLYINFKFNDIQVYKFNNNYTNYNIYKYSINNNKNNNMIVNKIIDLEKKILNSYNKDKIYKIKKLLNEKYIKIFNNFRYNNLNNHYNDVYMVLKISGICETENNVYLTFKLFFDLKHL